ncbi:MAG TPA: transglycosylase SLT domain-containing protein [Candidatus Limnocylindrales bacterium]|nr:transglycosylase SLT domain-containing protein [Candidatus Limnocylindrales bacterium]
MRLRSLGASLFLGVASGAVSLPPHAVTPYDAMAVVRHLAAGPLSGIRLEPGRPLSRLPAPPAVPLRRSSGEWDVQPDGSRPAVVPTGHNQRQLAIALLISAARRHDVDPSLVMALAYWESAWDQSKVSATGAIGLMQIEPQTAAADGPRLLLRPVDLQDPYDNTDLGAAILAENLHAYGSAGAALAAYYQGGPSLQSDGPYAGTQQYVQGILALAARIAAGQLPG